MPETDTAKPADDTADTDETAAAEDASNADEKSKASVTESSDSEQQADAQSGDDEDDEPEPMAPPVDQGPALRNDGALNLGLCHFGGIEEPASILATRSDGTGWIAVCEKHTKDAEEQGYVIEESSAANESADTSADTSADDRADEKVDADS